MPFLDIGDPVPGKAAGSIESGNSACNLEGQFRTCSFPACGQFYHISHRARCAINILKKNTGIYDAESR